LSADKSDLENTKECILPVYDKPYHKFKENMPHGEEHENLWNYPLFMPVVGDKMVLRVKKLKVYQCPQCPEVFYKESMLIYHHMRSHTQLTRIMPLFCHLCSYKTMFVSGIKKHMITDHLDEIGKECE